MQTTFLTKQAPGFPGMKCDTSKVDDVRSHAHADVVEIPFGVVVAKGATDVAAVLPTAAANVLLGIVLHNHSYAPVHDVGDTGLKPKTSLSIMRQGKVWVKVEDAVVAGQRAQFRYAGAGQKGGIRGANVANETAEMPGCVFLTSAAAGGLAQLAVDFNAVRAIKA